MTLDEAEKLECSHAFERIGEARPPFERCVRCYLTRKLESSR